MLAKTLFSAGLLGLAVSVSQPALADTRLVTYSDLDLSTKEGTVQLDARLRKAAREVCGFKGQVLPLSELESARQCYNQSLADARKAKENIKQPTALASAR